MYLKSCLLSSVNSDNLRLSCQVQGAILGILHNSVIPIDTSPWCSVRYVLLLIFALLVRDLIHSNPK